MVWYSDLSVLAPHDVESIKKKMEELKALKQWKKDALPYLEHYSDCKVLNRGFHKQYKCTCGLQSIIQSGKGE